MARLLLVVLIAAATTMSAASGSPNHPTGTQGILMIDKLGGHVRFFNPATYTEISGIQLPKNPHDFVLSLDHKLAYVPIYGDGVYGRNPNPGHEIYVIDLTARKVADVIDVSPYRAPHGMQVDAQGLLYVSCDVDRKLLVVDPRQKKVLHAIDTDGTGHWVSILPDASKAYVANKTDRPFVTVIDLKTRQIVARPPMPNGTQGIAASPDGTRVVAMDFKEPVMAVIDTATDQVVDRIQLQGRTGGAYKAFFSPDGRTLMTMAGSTLSMFDAANLRAPQRVITAGAYPMGYAFSADGKLALVANHDEGTVSVIDLATAKITRTFKAGTGIETLTYY